MTEKNNEFTRTWEATPSSYKSPLLAKFENEGRITMDQMRREVPLYQAGQKAAAELKSGVKLTAKRRRELEADVRAGNGSKDRLVAAGIPLIKSLTQKEFRRRQAWQSSVTFEDLFQDAMIGYLRGLMSYDPTGDYKSPTNYLGQWIITEMRRSSEPMDNDFEVSHEASERFRRIRALRSRLTGELGRTPTPEEIVEASKETIIGTGVLMGKASRRGQPKALTVEQVQEERDFSQRVGYTSRIVLGSDDDGSIEPGTVLADHAQPVLGAPVVDGAVATVERSVSEGLGAILRATMDALGMSVTHQDVIARRFGLAPYQDEQTVREIARAMSLTSTQVNLVVEAFQSEMSTPGGAFHKVCAAMDEDELADYGLGWVMGALGAYKAPKRTRPVNPTLVQALKKKSNTPPPPQGVLSDGAYGQYLCPFHQRAFIARYKTSRDIPKVHACPSCGRDSQLIRKATA